MGVNDKVLLIILSGWVMSGCAFNHSSNSLEPNHNCSVSRGTLRVLALNNPPFIYLNSNTSGIDMMILQTITEKLNLDVQLAYAPHIDHFINSSDKYDLIIGGITQYQNTPVQFIQSAPYFQDDVTLCVKRARSFPRWANVLFIIKDYETWLIGGILFAWGIVLLYLTTTYESRPMDAWESITFSLQTMLGVSSHSFKPNGIIIRILYIGTLFVQLLIVTIYNAYYFAFITRTISERQVTTIDEIIYSKYRIYGNLDIIKRLGTHAMADRFSGLNVCEDLDICLNQLQHQQKIVVAMSRLHFETSNQSNVYCFDRTQNLFTQATVFMIRRSLSTRDELIDGFGRLSMSGLIPKWARDLHIRNKPIEHLTTAKSLSMHEAGGPFAMCFPLVTLALFAAIAEQIIFWQLSKNRQSRFWAFADKLIDGHRHYMRLDFYWKKNRMHNERASEIPRSPELTEPQRVGRIQYQYVWQE